MRLLTRLLEPKTTARAPLRPVAGLPRLSWVSEAASWLE
jgi:hypothetical protein